MGYLGSKAASGAFQAIISQMPEHDTYVEPFLGSGAVMRAKPPAARSYGVDLDPDSIYGHPWPGHVEVVQADAFTWLEKFDFSSAGRVLVYADPPYLPETRSSARRYRHELTTWDHLRLLTLLQGLPAMVILSGYPSQLYDSTLSHWRSLSFRVMSRGGPRTEKLWMNFGAGELPNWSSFAGKDFTDRQRIKRKAARWAKDYADTPAAERLAILAAILETHVDHS